MLRVFFIIRVLFARRCCWYCGCFRFELNFDLDIEIKSGD